mmetsp:Transcript_44070/g.104282  ORF Transcript_44070/g.104282 Transcript_44070/m.104282 type:complete len:96 (+) Transcript_44070:572-859(+)
MAARLGGPTLLSRQSRPLQSKRQPTEKDATNSVGDPRRSPLHAMPEPWWLEGTFANHGIRGREVSSVATRALSCLDIAELALDESEGPHVAMAAP